MGRTRGSLIESLKSAEMNDKVFVLSCLKNTKKMTTSNGNGQKYGYMDGHTTGWTQMDGRTDGQTDKPPYRIARKHVFFMFNSITRMMIL